MGQHGVGWGGTFLTKGRTEDIHGMKLAMPGPPPPPFDVFLSKWFAKRPLLVCSSVDLLCALVCFARLLLPISSPVRCTAARTSVVIERANVCYYQHTHLYTTLGVIRGDPR